ncbi:DUF4349 domain-containing protein [Streptomyces sp. NPDC020983]|uniref:DUF4349 domain-containing protein n=1 Tax=Streptomyces sp. NPDC020983 TaxID=3365106 RepID=UPI003789AABF
MRVSARQAAPGSRRARHRRPVPAALLLAGALALAGCSASSGKDSSSSSDSAAGPAASAPAAGNQEGGSRSSGSGTGAVQDEGSGAKAAPSAGSSGSRAPHPSVSYLVRTASLSVRTPHVADALRQAKSFVADAGGYSGDEDTATGTDGGVSSTVQLRVPSAAYDGLLDRLSGLGSLLSRKVSVQDVTGKVVDVQSRVKSQKASVERVRALMQQATDLDDVVSLESELSTREADLESLEAQQASLQDQTNLATVTLTLSEPPAPAVHKKAEKARHDGFWTSVGHALRDGWDAFFVALRGVLVVLAVVLPFLLAVAALWTAYRVARRRWWPRREPDPDAATLRPPRGLPGHPQAQAESADPWRAPAEPAAVPRSPGARTDRAAPPAPAVPPVPPQAAGPAAQRPQERREPGKPGKEEPPPAG